MLEDAEGEPIGSTYTGRKSKFPQNKKRDTDCSQASVVSCAVQPYESALMLGADAISTRNRRPLISSQDVGFDIGIEIIDN